MSIELCYSSKNLPFENSDLEDSVYRKKNSQENHSEIVLYAKENFPIIESSAQWDNEVKLYVSKKYTKKMGVSKNTSHSHLRYLVESNEIPSSLLDLVKNYLLSEKGTLEVTNLTLPLVVQPSCLGLQEIANHYKEKYGIQISVCHIRDLHSILQGLQKENEVTPQGIIVSEKNTNAHVTPLIAYSKLGELKVASLDSVGDIWEEPYHTVERVCKMLNIQLGISPICRQGDGYSCRTMAAVILRNALIDFKQQDPSSLNDYVNSILGPPNSSEHEETYYLPKLSAKWTYGDQIFPKDHKEEELIPRNQASKKELSNQLPQTIRSFRDRYQIDQTYAHKLQLPNLSRHIRHFHENSHLEELLKEWNAATIRVKIENEQLEIIWYETKNQNAYMVEKAEKYRRKVFTDNR